MFQLKFLGEFQALGAQGAIDLRTRKARALLLLLATKQDGAARNFLAGMLWPRQEDRQAKQSLRQALSDLRAAFGAEALIATAESVRLNRSLFESDLERFQACKGASEEEQLREAAELYRGPFGANLNVSEEEFDNWLATEARHYTEDAVAVLDRLIGLLIGKQQFQNGLVFANRLLAIDPLREATHRHVLNLELLLHGRARALARFEELRSLLRNELNVEPEPETLELVARIRSAKPDPVPHAENEPRLPITPARPLADPTARTGKGWKVAAAAVLLLLAGVAGFWWWTEGSADQRIIATILPSEIEPEPFDETSHSIVVLPFAVAPSSDELREAEVELVAKVTGALSLSPPLTVISYQTARTYKADDLRVRTIGQQLDTKYAVVGSIQRENGRHVAYPRLLDTRTEAELWSGRFELKEETANEIADEISIAIGRRIERAIERVRTRSEAQDPPEAMTLIRQGNAIMNTTLCGRLDPKAGHLFSEALRVHPGSARARMLLAQYLINEIANVRRANFRQSLMQAQKLALEAIELAPDEAGGHFAFGLVRRLQGRNDESLASFERALKLEPNNASVHAQIGFSKMLLGRFEETEPLIRKAIRLNPRNSANCIWATIAGMANFYLERDQQAVAWFKRAIELGPHIPRNHQFLAAIYALRGERAKAAEHVEIMLNMSPPTTLKHIRSFPGNYQDPRYQKQRARFIHGAELAFGFANKLEHRAD